VVAASTPLEDSNGNESKHCGYYKMKVMETHQSKEITQAVTEIIEPECIIFSDKSTSYVDLKDSVKGHYNEISSTEKIRVH
jgi:putative lipoic acid-binding regulatory protein